VPTLLPRRRSSAGTRVSLVRVCSGLVALLPIVEAAWLRAAEKSEDGKGRPLLPLPAEAPSPEDNPATPANVALGKQLFFDPRLSGDNKTSCGACHLPDKAFTDGKKLAAGKGVEAARRNTVSLLDVGFHSTYTWDGRAKTLEEQALLPIQSAGEMNQGLDDLEKELNAVPGYAQQFQAVFGTGVTRAGIARALAAFERTLVTRASPLDRYLGGEKDALSEEAQEGMRLFLGEAGCIRCHLGPLLTDEKFHRLGVSMGDKGRGAVTGKKEDDYSFRTPSLRNVALTGPYMHDGSLETLEEVITFYYRRVPTTHPEGLPLDVKPLLGQSFSEISPLVAFLKSLTGKAPEITPPDLP
jgi:cytochrome c peroxidase